VGEAVGEAVSVGIGGPAPACRLAAPASKAALNASELSSDLPVASGLVDGRAAAPEDGLLAGPGVAPPTVGELGGVVCADEVEDELVDGVVDALDDGLPVCVGLPEDVGLPVGDPVCVPPGVVQLGVAAGPVAPPFWPGRVPVPPTVE
jgi:hypothetical protein